jgi:hypothetical protein
VAKVYTKTTWLDEVLAAAERYNILENGGGAFKANMQINLATGVTQAGTTANAARMNNIENGVDALDTLLDALLTGWVAAPALTRTGATTFTAVGNVTALFPVGTKIKLTDTTTKYFYVVSAAYTSLTTVTVTGGSDYSLVGAISNPYYSYDANPQGFPAGFNWVPTFTGLTVVGTPTYTGFFTITGGLVKFAVSITSSTSTASTNGSTYINNLPLSAARPDVSFVSSNFNENLGTNLIINAQVYLPTWSASSHVYYVSGSYFKA